MCKGWGLLSNKRTDVPRETLVSRVLLLTKKTGEHLPPFFRKEFHGIFNSSILYT
jgi:hypothetical protein